MLAELLLPNDQELHLGSCYLENEIVTVEMTSQQGSANCPQCGTNSTRIHSHYQRKLADLPCMVYMLRLVWTVRRFFCDNPECKRVTFVEQVPSVARRYVRKTNRLADYQTWLAYVLGGRPGERLAKDQRISVSHDTLIRLIRDTPDVENTTPTVMGVDDWAIRKGQSYGTILVDLETHKPVDLLPERSADTLATWLKEHPGIEIISRDRSNEYIKGLQKVLPMRSRLRIAGI